MTKDPFSIIKELNERNLELSDQRTRLIRESLAYKEALITFGDHTVECHMAPTVRCICGWRLWQKELGLEIR